MEYSNYVRFNHTLRLNQKQPLILIGLSQRFNFFEFLVWDDSISLRPKKITFRPTGLGFSIIFIQSIKTLFYHGVRLTLRGALLWGRVKQLRLLIKIVE